MVLVVECFPEAKAGKLSLEQDSRRDEHDERTFTTFVRGRENEKGTKSCKVLRDGKGGEQRSETVRYCRRSGRGREKIRASEEERIERERKNAKDQVW